MSNPCSQFPQFVLDSRIAIANEVQEPLAQQALIRFPCEQIRSKCDHQKQRTQQQHESSNSFQPAIREKGR